MEKVFLVIIILSFTSSTFACRSFSTCDTCIKNKCQFLLTTTGNRCVNAKERITGKVEARLTVSTQCLELVPKLLPSSAVTNSSMKVNLTMHDLQTSTSTPRTFDKRSSSDDEDGIDPMKLAESMSHPLSSVAEDMSVMKPVHAESMTPASSTFSPLETNSETSFTNGNSTTTPNPFPSTLNMTISYQISDKETNTTPIRNKTSNSASSYTKPFECPISITATPSTKEWQNEKLNCLQCLIYIEVNNLKRIFEKKHVIEDFLYEKRLRRCMSQMRK